MWEQIFAIRTDCFLLGINFCDFQKVSSTRYPTLILFSFFLRTCNGNIYFQTILQYAYVKSVIHCTHFVSGWREQVVVKQTQFLTTVFFCSEFTLENICSGVNFSEKMFAVNFICGSLFLRIAGKIAKSEPLQILCHTVGYIYRVWKLR